MRNWMSGAVVLAVAAGAASGQTVNTVMQGAPAVTARDVCFYGGLAYSENAVLTVEVPLRKESPQALQKHLLLCGKIEGSDRLGWISLDPASFRPMNR